MVKRFKNKAKKLSSTPDCECWFACGNKTCWSMEERDGSEIWCCPSCMWEIGRIRKFKPKTRKYTEKERKEIFGDIPRVKLSKNASGGEVKDG